MNFMTTTPTTLLAALEATTMLEIDVQFLAQRETERRMHGRP